MARIKINNQILPEAISNENFQRVLKQIREIIVLPVRSSDDDQRLKILSIRAKSFVGSSSGEIVDLVKKATEGELEIILGNYSGEIPVVR